MANNIQVLTERWQRHDWQTSPYAPGLRIIQALVDGKATASGAGLTRHDAYMRCLGETAEITALQSEIQPSKGSEGVAAGPDIAFAEYAALCERLERWAIKAWWACELVAVPLLGGELHIKTLRKGAQLPRVTQFWQLKFDLLNVVICVSNNAAGNQPILGFGADLCAEQAARSALIETGLMELNLAECSPHLQPYFDRISSLTSTLFPSANPQKIKATALAAAQKLPALKARLKSASIDYTVQELTAPQTGLAVVRATISGAPGFSQTEDRASSPLL